MKKHQKFIFEQLQISLREINDTNKLENLKEELIELQIEQKKG